MRARISPPLLAGVLLLQVALPALIRAQSPDKSNQPPSSGSAGSTTGNRTSPGTFRTSTRLLLGDVGPGFRLESDLGGRIRLQDLRGRKEVVLIFVQQPEMRHLGYSALADTLAARDIQVYFICQQQRKKGEKSWANAPVLYDRWGDVSRNYGAFDLITHDTVPGVFVLDRRGLVRYLTVGDLPDPISLGVAVENVLRRDEDTDS